MEIELPCPLLYGGKTKHTMKGFLFTLYGLIALGLYKGLIVDASSPVGPMYAIYGTAVVATEAHKIAQIPDRVVAKQGVLWMKRIVKYAIFYYYFSAWRKICYDPEYRDYFFDLGGYVHQPEWAEERYYVYKLESKLEKYVARISEAILGKVQKN